MFLIDFHIKSLIWPSNLHLHSYDIFVVIVVRAAQNSVFLLIVCVCKGIKLGNQWVVEPQYIPLFQNTTAYPTLTTSISKWSAMKSEGIPSLLRTKINLLSVRLVVPHELQWNLKKVFHPQSNNVSTVYPARCQPDDARRLIL